MYRHASPWTATQVAPETRRRMCHGDDTYKTCFVILLSERHLNLRFAVTRKSNKNYNFFTTPVDIPLGKHQIGVRIFHKRIPDWYILREGQYARWNRASS